MRRGGEGGRSQERETRDGRDKSIPRYGGTQLLDPCKGVRIAFEFQERLCDRTFERTDWTPRLEIWWSVNPESSPCNQKENHQGLACR